jgi:hypothetical protein
MRRPIVLVPETDIAILIFALVIVAERIRAGLGGQLIEPATRQDAAQRLNLERGRAGAGIRHHLGVKTSIIKMIRPSLPCGPIGVSTVVRQRAQRLAPAPLTQFVNVNPRTWPTPSI